MALSPSSCLLTRLLSGRSRILYKSSGFGLNIDDSVWDVDQTSGGIDPCAHELIRGQTCHFVLLWRLQIAQAGDFVFLIPFPSFLYKLTLISEMPAMKGVITQCCNPCPSTRQSSSLSPNETCFAPNPKLDPQVLTESTLLALSRTISFQAHERSLAMLNLCILPFKFKREKNQSHTHVHRLIWILEIPLRCVHMSSLKMSMMRKKLQPNEWKENKKEERRNKRVVSYFWTTTWDWLSELRPNLFTRSFIHASNTRVRILK